MLLEERELVYNVIRVSQTWCSNTELQNNSNLSLTGFDSVPYKRGKKSWGGGVLIFIKKNLSYKIREDLCESVNLKKYFPSKFRIKPPSIYF